MNKLLRCKCGRLFIQQEGELECAVCTQNKVVNDDPFLVAPINIMKLVDSYRAIAEDKLQQRVSAIKEIDFVLNRGYMKGYISEEFYVALCEQLGLTPDLEEEKHININYYDTSREALLGSYFEQFDNEEYA